MDSLPLCLHGQIFSLLDNSADREALVHSSKRLFHANPDVMHQLTRLRVFADTRREDVSRVPRGARMREVVVHQAPRDRELWSHEKLHEVGVVKFLPWGDTGDEAKHVTSAIESIAGALSSLHTLEVPVGDNFPFASTSDVLQSLAPEGCPKGSSSLKVLRVYQAEPWCCDYNIDTEEGGRVLQAVMNSASRLGVLQLTSVPKCIGQLALPPSLHTLEFQMAEFSDFVLLRSLLMDSGGAAVPSPPRRRVIVHSIFLQQSTSDDAQEEDDRVIITARAAGRALADMSPLVQLAEDRFGVLGFPALAEEYALGPSHQARALRAFVEGGAADALRRVRRVVLRKMHMSDELMRELAEVFTAANAMEVALDLDLEHGVTWPEETETEHGLATQGNGRVEDLGPRMQRALRDTACRAALVFIPGRVTPQY